MKTAVNVPALALVICLLGGLFSEIAHHREFRDFFGYGFHTDVILGNSNIGINNTYLAKLWNFTAMPLEIEGCKSRSANIGEPDSGVYRWGRSETRAC